MTIAENNMNFPTAHHKLSFDQLTNLFTRKFGSALALEPVVGGGSVQILKVERGLEVRFWNCCFNQGIELNGHANMDIKSKYFTLVCFLNTEGIRLYTGNIPLKENIVWNLLFLSAKSNYKMYIAPYAFGQCISISFTRTWLKIKVLENNEAFRNLEQKVDTIDAFSLLGTMKVSEKKTVQELFEYSWKKMFGRLYIKSIVLQVVSDFLYRVKEKDSLNIQLHCLARPAIIEK